MSAFSYRALDANGKTVKGTVEGDSERQVRAQLRSQQLRPLEVTGVTQQNTQSTPFYKRGKNLSGSELTLVTRQLASLVNSGLPLDESLKAAAKQHRKAHVKETLLHVRGKVLEGLSLAQALGDNPKAFDDMYRALVRAGESAGYLGPVLERLADYTETSQHTRQKLKGAMIYPFVLLAVSVLVISLLMAFVVPELIGIFEHSQRELPLLTRILVSSSHFITSYGLFCLVGLIGFAVACKYYLRVPARRRKWHGILLNMPVVGGVIVQSDSSRFAGTLSMLVGSGVPLLEALRIAGQVLSNLVMKDACEGVVSAVKEGSSLHRALDQAEIFPPLLVQMAASGEANGELDKQLDHAARNQERELELMLGTALGLLEPLTVVFMGGMVTLIVLAILMPIFDLNKLV